MIKTMAISVLLFFNIQSVFAALIDKGNGLLYEDVLNVTFIADPQGLDRSNILSFVRHAGDGKAFLSVPTGGPNEQGAAQFVATLNYKGITGWRLPHASGAGFRLGFPDPNISDADLKKSELAYVYYRDFGNPPAAIPSPTTPGQNVPNPAYDFNNLRTGPFISLQKGYYWMDAAFDTTTNPAVSVDVNSNAVTGINVQDWVFNFGQGSQSNFFVNRGNNFSGFGNALERAYILPVHDGDVAAQLSAVPLPPAVFLLFSGIAMAVPALGKHHKIR
ncbi:MAG: hypothetical protein AXA67_04095 [Methylothermaceae bacteria B42]|nr:MAG: hypothetical protein AXA67_04095 [Methylothermaceae bacteria B42]HHJ38625.1 hypothetical protein [Methylothermaceae bacterium]